MIKTKTDRAGFTQIAASLGKGGAHVRSRAVAVIGERLDDDANAADTKTLIAHFIEIIAARLPRTF